MQPASAAGIAHARAAIAAGKHIVMVNVEADVLAGPLLARKRARAGVVYSLAYGDQPALTCELVDWARACGFAVGGGQGHKIPAGVSRGDAGRGVGALRADEEEARRGGMNPQMFNSFLDGTKSAIEMAAIANATGSECRGRTRCFRRAAWTTCRLLRRRGRRRAGAGGMVEVVSSLERDGRPVFRDLRWGVYVVLKAPNE